MTPALARAEAAHAEALRLCDEHPCRATLEYALELQAHLARLRYPCEYGTTGDADAGDDREEIDP
jgi:hypothetical protein